MKKCKILGILILVAVMVLCLALSACGLLDGLLGNGGEHTTHKFASGWTSDSTHHWHKCAGCDEISSKTEHVFTEWKVDAYPTETEDGSRSRSCLICDYVDTETLPALGQGHSHTFDKWVKDNDYTHHAECVCGEVSPNAPSNHVFGEWVLDKAATTTEEGLRHKTCGLCLYSYSEIIPKIPLVDRTVDLYAINDFHGATDKMSQTSGYLSQQKNLGNTILLNSGDMFQGSMLSNSNYGSLLAQCMDDTGFDAFVYGNHEFDWGLDNLRNLA